MILKRYSNLDSAEGWRRGAVRHLPRKHRDPVLSPSFKGGGGGNGTNDDDVLSRE